MSRTETFGPTTTVDITGQAADSIDIDCVAYAAQATVTLVPAVPGDQEALERIQAAEVEHTGTALRVRMPQPHGGIQHGGGGTTTTIIQSGGRTVVRQYAGHVASGTHIVGAHVVGDGNITVGGDVFFGGGSMVTGGSSIGGGAVRVLVSVPQHVSVQARTVSGDITQRGRAGAVTATTVSGDIHCDTTGVLSLTSVSGDVMVSAAEAGGSVKSTSGDVAVTVPGAVPVSAQTVSGDIRGRGPVRARSVSGDVRVR